MLIFYRNYTGVIIMSKLLIGFPFVWFLLNCQSLIFSNSLLTSFNMALGKALHTAPHSCEPDLAHLHLTISL